MVKTKEKKAKPKEKDLFNIVQEDKNGFVDMKKFYKDNPQIKLRLAEKLKVKQEMIIDSITDQDLISADLRDKALSSKVLGEEVLDLEEGRRGNNVNILIEQTPIYAGKSVETLEKDEKKQLK